VKNLKLKVVYGLFLWLILGLSGSQTYASLPNISSFKEFQHIELKKGVLPTSPYFEQVSIQNLTPASQNELPALPSIFLPGNLNLLYQKSSFKPNSPYFRDLRYNLKIRIFPFHFFW